MRLIYSSAVVFLLLLSACDKKNESSAAGGNSDGPAKPSKMDRRSREEREQKDRVERNSKAKEEILKALEAAEKEPDPQAREKALAAVAWDAIDIDREIAQRAFAGLTPGGEDAKRLVAHFAMRLADNSPDAALEWARSLERPEERDDAIGRIAAVVAESDPKLAIALTNEVPEGLMRDRASVQIVQRWSQSKPADAAQWVATLPEGRARKAALQNLANSWLGSDPVSFAKWASNKDPQLPELASAVAISLRFTPDEGERLARLAAFTDDTFRARVEEELEQAGPTFPPPLPSVPPASK